MTRNTRRETMEKQIDVSKTEEVTAHAGPESVDVDEAEHEVEVEVSKEDAIARGLEIVRDREIAPEIA